MITSRPPSKPSAKALTRAVGRSPIRGTSTPPLPATYPERLFASGEQGAWYDFSDLTTMFQDIAMTIPVTTFDSRIAIILDKSGRGNHASQETPANRPWLRANGPVWYLEFDGTDDFFTTLPINFTGTDKISVFAGYMKASDAAMGVLVELGASVASNAGTFNVTAPDSAAANYGFNLNGGTVASRVATSFAALAASNVLSVNFDLAGAAAATEIAVRANGVTPTLTAVGAAGGGSFANAPLNIGRRGGATNPTKGYLTSLIIRGAATDATGIAGTEQHIAGKSGVVIP